MPRLKSALLLADSAAARPVWRGLLALLLVVITALALVPDPPRSLSTGWDKSNHMLAFAALAFTGVRAHWRLPRQWPRLIGLLLAYGVALEIAQHFLPPRSADWHDVVADGAGVALGLLAAATAARWLARMRCP